MTPAAAAREEARRILAERRFHGSGAPHPFRGILRWLGEQLSFLGRPFVWLIEQLPGWLTVLLAAGAVVLIAVVATRVVQARGAAQIDRRRRGSADGPEDPDALERAAAEA